MLLELRIGQIGLVDDLALVCSSGLTILTGETGAGKSMVAGALSLLRGGSADKEFVREGEELGWVEAVFDLSEAPATRQDCQRIGVILGEDGVLILRRELRRSGRGRVLINGRLSSLSVLEKLGSRLLSIQSQHQQLELSRAGFARDVLDSALELGALREQMQTAWSNWRDLLERLRRRRNEAEAAREQADIWRYQRDELSAAGLEPDEETQLSETLKLHQNMAAIKDAVAASIQALESGEGHVVERLGRGIRNLEQHAEASPRLREVVASLHDASEAASTASLGLDRFLDSLDVDSASLDELQQRKSLYEDLRRKYKLDVPAMIARLADLEGRIAHHDAAADDLAELENKVDQARDVAQGVASELHRRRCDGAAEVSQRAAGIIRPLALADLVMSFQVTPRQDSEQRTVIAGIPCQLDANGADDIVLEVATNLGERLRAVDSVASGGERSRIHLGLTVMLRAGDEPPLLMLDEIDAGLGMDAARPVAGLLRDLATDAQLLCITHLATMAVHGQKHWRVGKSERDGRTVLTVTSVTGDDRIAEVERLLGGSETTEVGQDQRAFAQALLDEAH
jgi:DNA repair protein RecN (Recombination protein N)